MSLILKRYNIFAFMVGINNIIFDLGNVILNIDYDAPVQAFKALGIENFDEIFSKRNQNKISDDFETGQISDIEFINYLQPLCKENTTQQQVIDAWNTIIKDFPISRLRLLQQLQLHYNLFLLSNTNSLHETFYNKLLMETVSYPTIGVFFDKVYLSHRIGYRKPNPKAWEIILEENNLKASETLFLDDSPQHIEAAKKMGMQCIHITPEHTMNDVFKTI